LPNTPLSFRSPLSWSIPHYDRNAPIRGGVAPERSSPMPSFYAIQILENGGRILIVEVLAHDVASFVDAT